MDFLLEPTPLLSLQSTLFPFTYPSLPMPPDSLLNWCCVMELKDITSSYRPHSLPYPTTFPSPLPLPTPIRLIGSFLPPVIMSLLYTLPTLPYPIPPSPLLTWCCGAELKASGTLSGTCICITKEHSGGRGCRRESLMLNLRQNALRASSIFVKCKSCL